MLWGGEEEGRLLDQQSMVSVMDEAVVFLDNMKGVDPADSETVKRLWRGLAEGSFMYGVPSCVSTFRGLVEEKRKQADDGSKNLLRYVSARERAAFSEEEGVEAATVAGGKVVSIVTGDSTKNRDKGLREGSSKHKITFGERDVLLEIVKALEDLYKSLVGLSED